MKKSRVFVIQQPMKKDDKGNEHPAFDFSAAEEYGAVEILAPNGKSIFTPDVLRNFIDDKLDELKFDARHDYVVPVGDYSVIFLVGMIMGCRGEEIKILRWVPSAKAYQPVSLIME
jgi:hypothetical protein